MTRFTLHVPITLNDGREVAREVFDELEHRLLGTVGGFTKSRGIGGWRGEEQDYREHVDLYHVDTDDSSSTRGVLVRLAQWLASTLEQEAVYLTAQEIVTELVTAEQVAA